MKLTLIGKPITKKNSQKIIKRGSRYGLSQSSQYKAYERDCLKQITAKYRKGLVGALHCKCEYWLPDKRKRDLTNLLAATHDILQKAGVIVDDADIVSLDGSRIMGVDKDNPRVEVTVSMQE